MADFSTLASLIAVMISFGTLLLAWRKAPYETRNTSADTGQKVTDAAVSLIEPMRKQIAELEAARERNKIKFADLEKRISDLETQVKAEQNFGNEAVLIAERLYHQVESLGGMPVATPPKRKTVNGEANNMDKR